MSEIIVRQLPNSVAKFLSFHPTIARHFQELEYAGELSTALHQLLLESFRYLYRFFHDEYLVFHQIPASLFESVLEESVEEGFAQRRYAHYCKAVAAYRERLKRAKLAEVALMQPELPANVLYADYIVIAHYNVVVDWRKEKLEPEQSVLLNHHWMVLAETLYRFHLRHAQLISLD